MCVGFKIFYLSQLFLPPCHQHHLHLERSCPIKKVDKFRLLTNWGVGGAGRRLLEGGLVKYQTFVLFEPSFFKEKRLYAYKHIGQKILHFHNQSSEIFAEYKFRRIPLSLPATWPRQHLQHILHQLGNGGWNTDD